MNVMYDFLLTTEEEVEVPQESTNAEGQKVTTHVKTKLPKSQRYGIKKPNRKLREEAQLFNAKTINNLMRLGILSHAQLARQLDDDGGTISKGQKAALEAMALKLGQVSKELEELGKKEQTDDVKKQIAQKNDIIDDCKKQLQTFYVDQMSPYNNTAEIMARNKTLAYYVNFLSLKSVNGNWVEMFTGDYDQRADQQDEALNDADELDKKAIDKLNYLIGNWFAGTDVSTRDKWVDLDKTFDQGTKPVETPKAIEPEVAVEPEKVAEPVSA